MGPRCGRDRGLWLSLPALVLLAGLTGTVMGVPPGAESGLAPPQPVADAAALAAPPSLRGGADPSWVLLPRGESQVRLEYTPAEAARSGVLWLSGTDGGIDGPFDGFYSRLARSLQRRGIASAQLEYSSPGNFETSLNETLAALDYLEGMGLNNVALVGFSFGGGLTVEVAAERPEVSTAVILSGQGFGTDRVAEIAPRPVLVVHTEGDPNIPVDVARSLFSRAGVPTELVVLSSSDHYLQDVAREARGLVRGWLSERLASADRG